MFEKTKNRLMNGGSGSVKIPLRARLFNFGYGIGASVVILGAMFKLLYWKGANEMLMIGMITEAIIFAVSAFERPFKIYEWDKIFDFQTGKMLDLHGAQGGVIASGISDDPNQLPADQTVVPGDQSVYQGGQVVIRGGGIVGNGGVTSGQGSIAVSDSQVPVGFTPVSSVEGLSDDDAQKLKDSIENLARTASQLQEIASFAYETEKFTGSIRTISENTTKYAESQENLILATKKLQDIYQRIGEDTEKIEINTQEYKSKVERINSNLAGMNSIYEIQLKDIHAQSVHFHNQAEISKSITDEMKLVTKEIGKMKDASDDFTSATQKLKTNANQLADNIEKLNQIYGNMLNAMS